VGRSGCGYRAFISYSHADRRVVEWLHAALEAHRVPAKLVGELTPLGRCRIVVCSPAAA
jgi:hypothetical protein